MLTRIIYKGNGTTTDFGIPFPYLDRTHVRVRVNMVVQFLENDYHFLDDGTIRFRAAPLADDAVEIYRATEEANPLVQYQDGSVLTERELNLAVLQNLYLIQETKDLWQSLVDGRLAEIVNNGTSAGGIIDSVVGEILSSQLLADLQQRISDIDLNAQTITATRVDVAGLRLRVEELTSVDLEGLDTLIAQERDERIEGDTALASTLNLIGARSGDSTAFVLNTEAVRVSPTESLANRLAAITSRFGTVEALISTEQTTRAAADSAFAGQLTTISSRLGAAEAAVNQEVSTRASADSALSSRIDNVVASVGDVEALISDEATTRATQDDALSNRLSVVEASTSDALAQIANEATARASADTSLTNQLSQALSRIGTAEALIQSEATTRASADSAMATRVDGIEAELADEAAAIRATIQTEQTARADGDSALAQSISTLQTEVGGNTASIQTIQTVTNGLSAQYMLKTDVNGHVAGFGLYNTGATSEFIVAVDRFAVASGGGKVIPFAVDGNGVYINTAYIRNLVVDKIAGGNIGSQWNMQQGGGRIVLDTGTHMKVIGVGFGANGDLVEWYGPKMAISACTKANGVTWTDTSGNAYFGGNLKAGTLYNAARTTNTQGNAEVILGPFDTNGNPKTVVLSYSFSKSDISTAMGSSGYTYAGGTPSATILLYRRINNGAETLIATWTYTGTWDINNEFDGPDGASQHISGSNTYTDNTGPSQITYRAVISNRTVATFNHPNSTQVVDIRQSLGIVSTEQ